MEYHTLNIGLVDTIESSDSESVSLAPNVCLHGAPKFVHTILAFMNWAMKDASHLNRLRPLSLPMIVSLSLF